MSLGNSGFTFDVQIWNCPKLLTYNISSCTARRSSQSVINLARKSWTIAINLAVVDQLIYDNRLSCNGTPLVYYTDHQSRPQHDFVARIHLLHLYLTSLAFYTVHMSIHAGLQ